MGTTMFRLVEKSLDGADDVPSLFNRLAESIENLGPEAEVHDVVFSFDSSSGSTDGRRVVLATVYYDYPSDSPSSSENLP